MSRKISVPRPLVTLAHDGAVSRGMYAIMLRIGAEIDGARLSEDVSDAVWFSIPAAELRGGNEDNHWLRQWLRRLMKVEVGGVARGNPWGAVLVAEWRIERGGSLVRVLVPPGAVNALRDPETFAQVDADCVGQLSKAAQRLYVAICDRRRQRSREAEFGLVQLRAMLGVGDKRAYARWDHFAARVLGPAVESINAVSPLVVEAIPVRHGRPVAAVRFEWRLKRLDELRDAEAEAERHSRARGKSRDVLPDAPPLSEAVPRSPAEREKRRALLDELLNGSGLRKK